MPYFFCRFKAENILMEILRSYCITLLISNVFGEWMHGVTVIVEPVYRHLRVM